MPASELSAAERRVRGALLAFGLLDVVALLAVLMPRSLMDLVHQSSGLGPLPEGPIVGYLARTSSLLYGVHGAVILFVATDVRRYAPLVRFLARLAVVQGVTILAIDWFEQLPGWWQAIEGVCLIGIGIGVMAVQKQSERRPESVKEPAAVRRMS